MNIFKKSILFITVLCFSNLVMAQNPIYLEVGDCVKELQYKHSETDGTNYEYYDYHFALNDYETVIMQVSKYDFKSINTVELSNISRTDCNSDALEAQLTVASVEAIQRSNQSVFVIKQTDEGYMIAKVMTATYMVYLSSDPYLRVIAYDYSFDYDGSSTYDSGAELKTAGEGSFILFNEKTESCYEQPTFMHVPVNFMETANIDYVLGLGMTRTYSDDKETKLVAVNGQPINAYLASLCAETVEPTIIEAPIAETKAEVKTIIEETVVFEESVVFEEPVIETEIAVIEKPVVTTVVETETPMVEDVVAETEVVLQVPVFEEEEINMSLVDESLMETIDNSGTAKGGDVIRPITEETTTKEVEKEEVTKEEKNANIHTVVKGETLYSLSKKYDISTLKLKELNNMKENTIEVGQKLIIK